MNLNSSKKEEKKCFKSLRVEPAICKLLATSQTHHFSRRLFSYTCQLTLSPPFASARCKYIIDKNPEAIILCRITPRNVCIYTSVEDTKWMGICEERDWNQINRSKCFFFYFFLLLLFSGELRLENE